MTDRLPPPVFDPADAAAAAARFADLLPEVVLALGPHELAKLAAEALRPKEPPTVPVDHIHYPKVSVREQAVILLDRLREARQANFRNLTADCTMPVEVIARFLALLELFREGLVAFEQVAPLGDLNVRWTGTDESRVEVDDEYDAPPLDQAGEQDAQETASQDDDE